MTGIKSQSNRYGYISDSDANTLIFFSKINKLKMHYNDLLKGWDSNRNLEPVIVFNKSKKNVYFLQAMIKFRSMFRVNGRK